MNVRIIIVALVSCLVLASCGSEYQVEGSSSVSRLDGKMLFVKVSNGKDLIKVDSAEVIHGLFRMEGKIDSTVIASLYMDDQNIMPIVIEKGKIQIQIDNTLLVASGTPLNNKLYAEAYINIIIEKNKGCQTITTLKNVLFNKTAQKFNDFIIFFHLHKINYCLRIFVFST